LIFAFNKAIAKKSSRNGNLSINHKRQETRVMSQSYRSDLTDEQWEVIKRLIPAAKTGGRRRIH
jgi:hypothetical protein